MSVLIKGMEMPKNCDECPMFNLDIDGGCYCTKYFVIRKKDQDRPDWCPLVPVPLHGRLIDADALNYTMLYKENWIMGKGVEAPAVWKKDIDAAPTIIESEASR